MSVSLLTLRTRARQRADQVQGTLVSDSELNTYVNEAVQWVAFEMVSNGLFPDEVQQTIVVTGAASYTLTELVSIVSVERQEGSVFVPLRRVERSEVPGLRSTTGNAWLYDVVWGLRAAPSIRFWPNPLSGTYQVRVIPPVSALVADGDLIYPAGGWDSLIVLDAAIKCVRREYGDTRGMEMERQELLLRLRRELENRDMYSPVRVTPAPAQALGEEVFDPFRYSDRSGWNF